MVETAVSGEWTLMPEIRMKAAALGIESSGMEKADLIRAIQEAEGYTGCFGRSTGECQHDNCCFRQDCLGRSQTDDDGPDEELELSAKVPWPVTVQPDWLAEGILEAPRGLLGHLGDVANVRVLYDGSDDLHVYDPNEHVIRGLEDFYLSKVIAEGDKVYVQLQSVVPVRLSLHSSWKRPLDQTLQTPAEDWDWNRNSLRDCIVVALSEFDRPADCREIHSRISAHREISLESVVAALSRYSPAVFVDSGSGKWQLAEWAGGQFEI